MEVALAIFRTIKTSSWFKKLWSKGSVAEFRREAFQLFEDLLFKVKTETIKFLINTNIVIQDKKEEKQTGNFVKKRKNFK